MLILSFFVATAAALDWFPPPLTADGQNTFSVDGWTPKPTAFLEMAKRIEIPSQDTICGYGDGDPDAAFDCSGYPCGYNTLYSWFGCCATASYSGTELVVLGCPIVTECVPYAELGQCNAACASNTMITKCTDSASGYCGYGELVEIPGMTAVACAPTPFTLEVDLTTTGGGAGSSIGVGQSVSPVTTAKASTTQTQAAPTITVGVMTLGTGSSSTQTSQKAGSTNTPSVLSLGGQSTTSSTSAPAATHNSSNGPVSAIRASFVGEVFTALMMLFNLM